MSYFPPTGSVVSFQQDATKLTAMVSVVSYSPQSVAVLQGTNPWVVGNSSVQVNNIVTGQSSVYLIPGVGVLGSVAALQGTNPWVVQLTSGSVITTGGNSSVQIVGAIPPASVSGVGLFNVNHTGNGSILANLQNSSVATLQGTNPWIVQLTSGSVITTGGNSSVMLTAGINTIGSVAVLQGTNPWQITGVTSMVGGFVRTEDNAHASGDLGLFILTVRNDTVASFVSANQDYAPLGVDSAGRVVVKPFAPTESSVVSHGSIITAGTASGAASVRLMAAPGAGLRNYITDFLISNTGAATTLITFIDDDSSVLGKTIAPAGGGSNGVGLATPISNVSANQSIGMIIATASSVVHATVGGYKAP